MIPKNEIPGFSVFLKFRSAAIQRMAWPYAPDNALIQWRARILFSILFSGLILGAIAFIGTLAAIAEKGSWGMAVSDVISISLTLFLLNAPKIKFEFRAAAVCMIFFSIGAMVILSIGPQIGGPAWLFGFSVLSGVLLGWAYALGAVVLNTLFLIMLSVLVLNGNIEYNMPFFSSPKDMIAAITNFTVVNAITAILVSTLVKGIFKIYQEKFHLTEALEQKQENLLLIQNSLEAEIIERKIQEEKLRASEKRFREMSELMPETIFEADTKGILTFANKRGFDLFGFTEDDFQNGINIFQLIVKKDKDAAARNVKSVLKGKSVGVNEYEISRKDGSTFPALFHSSVIYSNGKAAGFRGVLIDITEKKKTQEHLSQVGKMMSVGGLAAGMAHEMNNPLAGMIQNAQLIRNRLTQDTLPANIQAAGELDTDMRTIQQFMEKRGVIRQLENIQQAGHQAAKIVDNLLSFAAKRTSNRTESDLKELIEETIELAENNYSLKKEYDFRQINIIRDYSPDVPAVLCDSGKIQQALFNVVKNAAEAAREKTTDSSPEITLRLKRDHHFACIEIEDSGPGIEPDIQKRIFEPFFTTKPVDKGTGLGLSISYFIIVEDHDGEITVSSTIGKGSTFIIRLPLPDAL